MNIELNNVYDVAPIAAVSGAPNASRVVELKGSPRDELIAAALLEGGIAALHHKIAWSCHLLLTSDAHRHRHELARAWLSKLGVNEYVASKAVERDGRLMSVEYPGGVLKHQFT